MKWAALHQAPDGGHHGFIEGIFILFDLLDLLDLLCGWMACDIKSGSIAIFGPLRIIGLRDDILSFAFVGSEHRFTGQDIGQKAADSDDFAFLIDDTVATMGKACAKVFNPCFGDQFTGSCGMQKTDTMLQRHDGSALSDEGQDRKLCRPTPKGSERPFGDYALSFEALWAKAHACGGNALLVVT